MVLFQDHPQLWAGIGNNPPPESPYWKEEWAVSLCTRCARHAKDWKGYCRKLNELFNYFYP